MCKRNSGAFQLTVKCKDKSVSSFLGGKQTQIKKKPKKAHFSSMLPTRVSSEGWYPLLQKLTGRRVSPGLQMFGQSISGNVDMDGNGYAGPVSAQMDSAPCVTLSVT